MSKPFLTKPTVILLYGFPGAGKSFFARQFCNEIGAVNVNGDQLRYEFFEKPLYNSRENDIVDHLTIYMLDQFLQANNSVVYDANTESISSRKLIREVAHRSRAAVLVVWLQLDTDSAFNRVVKRDHRKIDDRYTRPLDRTTFEDTISQMQNPSKNEDYIVISGKHTITTQKNAVVKKLRDNGLIYTDTSSDKLVKPELVNLVPNPMAGRVNDSRRNIVIR